MFLLRFLIPLLLGAAASASSTSTYEPSIFYFTGLSMRLEGMSELTYKSKVAFEEGTAAFYGDLYTQDDDNSDSSITRNHDGDMDFFIFKTVVSVTDDEPDADGNTITYNQIVTIIQPNITTDDEDKVIDLLLDPFDEDQNSHLVVTKSYLSYLTDRDFDFFYVTDVGVPMMFEETSSPNNNKTSSNNNNDKPVGGEPIKKSSSAHHPEEEEDNEPMGAGAIFFIFLAFCITLCCFVGWMTHYEKVYGSHHQKPLDDDDEKKQRPSLADPTTIVDVDDGSVPTLADSTTIVDVDDGSCSDVKFDAKKATFVLSKMKAANTKSLF